MNQNESTAINTAENESLPVTNLLSTTEYRFTRRGKVSEANKYYNAHVFGIRVDDDSPLSYEHLPASLSFHDVSESAKLIADLDLVRAFVVGVDLMLIEAASGGGIANTVRAMLANDGICNDPKMTAEKRKSEINALVASIINLQKVMDGMDLKAVYALVTGNLKPELRPVVVEPAKPEGELVSQ